MSSSQFLQRDAMLAQYMLSSCVCPSQAGTVSKDWTNQAGFAMEASFYDLSHIAL